MNFSQCIQCKNDLPVKVNVSQITCSFCGTIHTVIKKKVKKSVHQRTKSSNNAVIAAAAIIAGSDA